MEDIAFYVMCFFIGFTLTASFGVILWFTSPYGHGFKLPPYKSDFAPDGTYLGKPYEKQIWG